MEGLQKDGRYQIDDAMRERLKDFCGDYADEEETASEIASMYRNTGYVLDTHTAVAASVYEKYRKETGDMTPVILASTASPYKFTRSVLHAIDAEKYDSLGDFEQMDALSEISSTEIPRAIEEIRTAPVRHTAVCDVDQMEQAVKNFLAI